MGHADTAGENPERALAAQLFNGTWDLLERTDRTMAEDDAMLHMAHASRHHWAQVPDATPTNLARGEWQCSRAYAVLGRAEPALHHAYRCLEITLGEALGNMADFDLAFAHEALARAYAVAGDEQRARGHAEQSLAAAAGIHDDDDRALVLADLETIPGLARFW